MMRWAVDVTGIDVADDLGREQGKYVYVSPRSIHNDAWHAVDDWRPNTTDGNDELGEVWVLTRDEIADALLERAMESEDVFRTVQKVSSDSPSLQPRPSACLSGGGWNMSATRANFAPSPPHNDRLDSNSQSTVSNDFTFEPPPSREVQVFSTFLDPQGKRTKVTLTMPQATYRGVDVVTVFLQQTVASNEVLSQRFSTNPRLYKLFIADEYTGEEEMAAQLDLGAQNFSCYAVTPMPGANLYLFPQRSGLLKTTTRDINLTVQVRPLDPSANAVQRQCVVPSDMLAESLEATICNRLPASGIIQGSLRIVYGPLELNINEYYSFGPGCGQPNCPIAERTVLSLFRFGVREVVVNGRAVEEAPTEILRDLTEDIVIDMSVDEAVSFQQFEVICINKYGARQQRLLCVDGEHLYTMRPNDAETMPKTTERTIKDVEEVRTFPDKPKYMEIAYTKASHFEEDHFECTTTYNCALLNEKLRVVRRELRKRVAEEEEAKVKNGTTVQRFMASLRNRWFKGSSNDDS
ncbi:SAPK-interacting protein 1 (Sin1) Pleckstrin-homology [Lotmaria passim]